MGLNSQIEGFLKQAGIVEKKSDKLIDSTRIKAVIITPKAQFKALGVTHFTELADFIYNRAEVLAIKLRLQPSIYFDHVVTYRDDLCIQVIMDSESDMVIREYAATPMNDKDLRAQGNHSQQANLDAYDETNMVEYEFQLIDKGYNTLKNIPVSENYMMCKPGDVLPLVMETYSKQVKMPSGVKYKGLYLHQPIDNQNTYRQILIPQGTRLIDVPSYLQAHDEYGVYSKGLGSFYKQGYWWVYPLFNTELADKHYRPIDIIRVPQDKIPTLDMTFVKTANALTIISTGYSEQSDNADIRKQNNGVGKRLVMADAIAGDTGYHYTKGRAVTTRADTLQEYKLSDRRNGQEYVPLDLTPTSNVSLAMSENAMNEGEFVEVEWHNGDVGYLEPGHPVKYQYMGEGNDMVVRKGVLMGYRQDHLPITTGLEPDMKRVCKLLLFLKRQEKYKQV